MLSLCTNQCRQVGRLPVYIVGETCEADLPESRAEYNTDHGIELPSVNRLRSVFGAGKRHEDVQDENCKRVRKSHASLVFSNINCLRRFVDATLTNCFCGMNCTSCITLKALRWACKRH